MKATPPTHPDALGDQVVLGKEYIYVGYTGYKIYKWAAIPVSFTPQRVRTKAGPFNSTYRGEHIVSSENLIPMPEGKTL